MKKLSLTFVMFLVMVSGISQSATSIANGPWLSPFTWNCMCVPTPGYTVVINHQVTLNTSFQIPSGGITVSSGASLIQDTARDIMINGGFFVNNGKVKFRYLLLQTGSFTNTDSLLLKSFANYKKFVNSGVLHKVDSFYNMGYLHNSGIVSAKKFQNNDTLINDGLFIEVDSFYNMSFLYNSDSIIAPTFYTTGKLINNGTIAGVDSFTNGGILNNNSQAVIQADSMLNIGTLTNAGHLQHNAFANMGTISNSGVITFFDAFNLSQLNNSGAMTGAHSFWNLGRFNNSIGGNLSLGNSFLNADSIQHDASFFNNGIVVVDSNWFNADTVNGVFGSFVVADSSGNSGLMLGSFDFCDLSPPPAAPYIDINYGSISSQITWCNPQAPQAGFTAANVCEGNTVQFNNTSTGPIDSFFWDFGDGSTSTQISPQHNYSSSGVYNVKLSVSNTSASDSVLQSITVYPVPATPQVNVADDTISCLSSAVYYTWYRNGILYNSITTQNFIATQPGFYSVQITDANGCVSEMSDSVEVTVVNGYNIDNEDSFVRLYPNPCTEAITFEIHLPDVYMADLSITSMDGKQVLINTISGNQTVTVALDKFPAGLLFYELQSPEGVIRGRFIRVR
jgi:hypothetical protein